MPGAGDCDWAVHAVAAVTARTVAAARNAVRRVVRLPKEAKCGAHSHAVHIRGSMAGGGADPTAARRYRLRTVRWTPRILA
ncbi:hypothetical protein NIIDNTM18_32310 [Mycolicibacterium litorale]|uniref:Uncharacterized protein n=1 Tax=Mycolicibacterium litorale TaxID=758802 RepID=A0A6S6P279_9MYCO|nr:hypothetical protein NIIDNTM18_32310 [Mycolicibacterium litorale]